MLAMETTQITHARVHLTLARYRVRHQAIHYCVTETTDARLITTITLIRRTVEVNKETYTNRYERVCKTNALTSIPKSLCRFLILIENDL